MVDNPLTLEQIGVNIERSENIALLLQDIQVLTKVEDLVIRGGQTKTLPRSLLFFAAQNVGRAGYIENGEIVKLYDFETDKPCELEEAQTALDEFAHKYNLGEATQVDAVEALAELSDVFYNLAQLVHEDQFSEIVDSFKVNKDLFSRLLTIAKAKYTYRYVNVDLSSPKSIINSDFVLNENIIIKNALPSRRKDIETEVREVIIPIFQENGDEFLVELLVENWSHINTTLHAVYSTARTVARESDKQNGTSVENPLSLESQLIRSLERMPILKKL